MTKKGGLDWDAMHRQTLLDLANQIRRGEIPDEILVNGISDELQAVIESIPDDAPIVPRKAPANPRSRAGTKHKVERPRDPYIRYNHTGMLRMYQDEGKTVFEIAKAFGCQYETVYKALAGFGIVIDKSKAGAPKKEKCKAGHDLAEHGRPKKGGGRECMECKRRRDRERWARTHGKQQ